MNVMAPHSSVRQTLTIRPAAPGFAAAAVTGEDLMTRRQVARLFGVTSAAVATWARRGRLPEIRNEAGRPRYRRADVEALRRHGASGRRDNRAAVADLPGSR
jgi:MerR HTH family regulatory protein